MMPIARPLLRSLALVAALAAAGPARAADDAEAAPRWTLGALVQVDDEDGHAVAGSVGYAFTRNTRLRLSADASDASGAGTEYSTKAVGLDLRHAFGAVALTVGVHRWEDPDVVAADEFRAELEFGGESLGVALLGSYRRSDFEPIAANSTIQLRDGRALTVRARADCRLDDVGYGLRLAWSGVAWGAYASARGHDYGDVECRFDSPGLDALSRARNAEFRQFAGRATNALGLGAGTRIGAENVLLDRSVAAGAWFQPARFGVAADVARMRDYFSGTESDTLSASLLWSVTPSLDLELTLGTTDAERFGSTGFAGLRLQARF
ncbi:MAG: hypothetical protein ACK52I_03370 [Pseudomonadota bacterium]